MRDAHRRLRWVESPLLATVFCCALAAGGCEAFREPPRPEPNEPDKAPADPYDQAYVAALATVNRFCEAWQAKDVSLARALMTDRLIDEAGGNVNRAIVSAPNVRHEAYEIAGGRETSPNRFVFRWRQFLRYLGTHDDRIEAPLVEMSVVRDSDGAWRVDSAPSRARR